MNDQHFINKIKKMAKEVIPSGGQLFIYGSRARGDANEGSDWDLLIILDKSKIEQSDYDNVSFSFTMLGWENGQSVIPVLYTKEEWENSTFLPFYKNVEKDKILLQ